MSLGWLVTDRWFVGSLVGLLVEIAIVNRWFGFWMVIENGDVVVGGWFWVVKGLGNRKKNRGKHMSFCFKKDKIPTKLKLFFEVQGMICKNVCVSSKAAAGEKRT